MAGTFFVIYSYSESPPLVFFHFLLSLCPSFFFHLHNHRFRPRRTFLDWSYARQHPGRFRSRFHESPGHRSNIKYRRRAFEIKKRRAFGFAFPVDGFDSIGIRGLGPNEPLTIRDNNVFPDDASLRILNWEKYDVNPPLTVGSIPQTFAIVFAGVHKSARVARCHRIGITTVNGCNRDRNGERSLSELSGEVYLFMASVPDLFAD